MKNNKILLSMALVQLANLYRSELLILDFLKVLQHYASSDDLKWQIFGQRHLIKARNKRLRAILSSFDSYQNTAASCGEIRGILQHGLNMINQHENDEDKDLLVIHALLLVHYYMRSAYNIVGSYFLNYGCGMEAKLMQKYAQEEETAIEADMLVHQTILLA
ncbi:DUF892 family protein [Catalinimonas sp. 4WD22]|uniref:DUF892 family protein n=1 Tax=Catalinimonas locisalis TaxID=3133978 RepID=UPI003100E82F